MTDLSKTYIPAEHESRVWDRWLEADAFAANPARVLNGEAEPYCILIPPPNVTAALHLGHALNNTLQDVLTRAHRMKGFEALWMPGTDHAGIATQTVVDKRLKEAGEPALADYKKMEAAGELGREKFIEKVQAWKDEYEARITEQLQKMGCSCDWSRQRFTMDEICASAVREAFFRLFKDGLIERGKRLVNWDPVTQTALADDEVENHEVQGHFYYLRYPLVHAPQDPRDNTHEHSPVTWGELATRGYDGAENHPEDDEAWITIATTRPETYLGDVAVAVNPKDPRAAAVRGMCVQLPLVGRACPIIEDDYVVLPVKYGGEEGDAKAEYATGFLKVTPAHDPNDYELGFRHEEAILAHCSAPELLINIMAPDGSISDAHGWQRQAWNEDGHVFLGKTREEARDLVVREFQAHTLNNAPLLEDIKDYTHSVGHSYRSHAAIEYYLSDQWYCRVTDDRLRGNAQRALTPDQRTEASLKAWPESKVGKAETDATMSVHPPRYAKLYEGWHDNLRDWCISRQLWWGHRIPVWTSEAQTDLAFLSQEQRDDIAIQAGESGTSICVPADRPDIETGLEDNGFTQDPDVLDTWFSSALWPMSTLGWPNAELPVITPAQIEVGPGAGDPAHIRTVYTKAVGSWKDLIGVDGEPSGELIDVLLALRDRHKNHGGAQPLNYQLFSHAELKEKGTNADALMTPEQIQGCNDLVCAVGIKATDPVAFKDRDLNLDHFFLAQGFQNTAGLLDAFNPTSVLSTARDILTLWVSRMVMFNRYFMGENGTAGQVPFNHVLIHAMIQDGDGRKMSKSLGNGVDPLDIIHSHGADAMRFTLVEMTTQTQDVRMPVERDEETGRNTSPKFDLGRNFCNKLWNASRFAMSRLSAETMPAEIHAKDLNLADRWMLARLAQGVAEVDKAITAYQFSNYAKALYDTVRRDFCDWYLEATKPTIANSPTQQGVLRLVLDGLLRILHPVAPFITETIYENLRTIPAPKLEGLNIDPPRKGAVLATAAWPSIDAALTDPEAVDRFESMRELVETVRALRSQHQVEPKRKITLHPHGELADLVASTESLAESLAGIGQVTPDAPDNGSIAFTFRGTEYRLSDLADAVDAGAERDRLEKEHAALEKKKQALTGRLSNPGYTEKAPAHLVQQTRDELTAVEAELATIAEAMKRIGEQV